MKGNDLSKETIKDLFDKQIIELTKEANNKEVTKKWEQKKRFYKG